MRNYGAAAPRFLSGLTETSEDMSLRLDPVGHRRGAIFTCMHTLVTLMANDISS